MAKLALSPRRPASCNRRIPLSFVPYATTISPERTTMREQLEKILDSIPAFLDKTTNRVEEAVAGIPERVQYLFSEDGPLGALNFWRINKESIKGTGQQLLESGELLVKGDADGFREKASGIDLSWLKPTRRSEPANGSRPGRTVADQLQDTVLFLLESLTPWDFDRHDFGLTFVTVWNDLDTFKREGESDAIVKMTSTIKPLYQEWKLTARTKLLDLGENTAVFGKAGMYLAGNKPAYIGLEADRVWEIPRLPGTMVFVNVNYRSSRKPQADPIRTTVGIQQDFTIAKGIDLTLRLAFNPLDRHDITVTPIPNGSYF